MCLRSQTYGSRTLLHGLERILDLMQPALRGENGVIRVVCVAELYCFVKNTSRFRKERQRRTILRDGRVERDGTVSSLKYTS